MVARRNVIWIGGPAGAGKSTLARLLARGFGMRWYSGDTRTWDHRDRALEAGDPDARRFESLTPEQREALPPEQRDALHLTSQRRRMVLDDLARLPESPMVVADTGLLEPGMTVPAQAIWLTASPAELVARIERRGWGERRLERARTSQRRQEEAASGVVPTLSVDDRAPDQVLSEVTRLFANRIARGPVTTELARRRSLIREGNLWISHQYRYGLARHGRVSELPNVTRDFDFECTDRSCREFVRLAIPNAPVRAEDPLVLAPGHEPAPAGNSGGGERDRDVQHPPVPDFP